MRKFLRAGAWVATVFGIATGCGTPTRPYGDGASGAGGTSGGIDTGGSAQNSSGAGGVNDGTCMPGDAKSCYDNAEGMSFGGKPPEGQTTCRFGVTSRPRASAAATWRITPFCKLISLAPASIEKSAFRIFDQGRR